MLINELSVYAVVEQSTLSRALEQLDTDGLVKREIDIIDTRATRVYLTPLGLEAFKSLWPDMLTSYNEMFNDIKDDEKSQFIVTLQKILKNIRKHEF